MNGNLAMKDIELGLKWVKENISKFGGNQKSITLMGSGGGAAIANLLMLTNSLTKNFNQVIAMSGTGLANWSFQSDPISKGEFFLDALNCTRGNVSASVECLQNITDWRIIRDVNMSGFGGDFAPTWGPVLDGEMLNQDPVAIMKIREYMNFKMLVGFDEGEALNYLQNYSISGDFNEESWRNSVDSLVSSNFRTTQARQYIGQFIPFLYQNWINQPEDDTQACPKFKSKILQLFSDFNWASKAIKLATLNSDAGTDYQTFMYKFDHAIGSDTFPGKKCDRIGNAQSLPYAFGVPLSILSQSSLAFEHLKSNWTEGDKMLSYAMMTYWINFIKNGNPKGSKPRQQTRTSFSSTTNVFIEENWPRFTSEDPQIMTLSIKQRDPRNNKNSAGYMRQQMSFWNDLLPDLLVTKDFSEVPAGEMMFENRESTATVATELREINNKTFESFEDRLAEREGQAESIGVEIIITLSIGVFLFVVNGIAFLNIGLKKRRQQKQFRKNLELQIRQRIEKQQMANSKPRRPSERCNNSGRPSSGQLSEKLTVNSAIRNSTKKNSPKIAKENSIKNKFDCKIGNAKPLDANHVRPAEGSEPDKPVFADSPGSNESTATAWVQIFKVFTKFLPHQTSALKLIISKSIKLNYIKVVTVRKQSSLQDQELNEVELKQQDRQSWIYSRSQSNLQFPRRSSLRNDDMLPIVAQSPLPKSKSSTSGKPFYTSATKL